MNIESVKSLFRMFSGEDDSEKYAPLIELALSETEKMLLPDADRSDVRLNFLCAAVANHRCRQIISSRDRTEITYAGKMLRDGKDSALAYSEKLLRDYLELCSDLVKPQTFTFAGI